MKRFWHWCINGISALLFESFFIKKAFVLVFTLAVFSWIFYNAGENRRLLTYVGIMLMVTITYVEMLVIRDYLWMLEGSLPHLRKWRETFFPQKVLRRQKLRKIFIVVFAMAVYAWVFYFTGGSELFSFMGVILFLTILYLEVLTLRDDVKSIMACLKAQEIEEAVKSGVVEAVKGDQMFSETPSTEPLAGSPPESSD